MAEELNMYLGDKLQQFCRVLPKRTMLEKHDFKKREKNDKTQNGSEFGVIIGDEASSFFRVIRIDEIFSL